MSLKDLPARDRHLLTLRAWELQRVAELIGSTPQQIIEIGGGNGWQARMLHRMGHHVVSIDTEPQTDGICGWPVLKYDGHQIPYGDGSFDLVFSSNVLEHIADLDPFEQEIHRVLRSGGRAIHVLPTSAWRVWTSITHPFRVLRVLHNLARPGGHPPPSGGIPRSPLRYWYYALWPNRHGERGNSFTEIYWFSQQVWTRHFEQAGWAVQSAPSPGIFYTGQGVLNRRLDISMRRRLARYLGAATRIYVLRPVDDAARAKGSQPPAA